MWLCFSFWLRQPRLPVRCRYQPFDIIIWHKTTHSFCWKHQHQYTCYTLRYCETSVSGEDSSGSALQAHFSRNACRPSAHYRSVMCRIHFCLLLHCTFQFWGHLGEEMQNRVLWSLCNADFIQCIFCRAFRMVSTPWSRAWIPRSKMLQQAQVLQ